MTIPPNAKIWIDGRELSSRSPWQEPVEVGKVYDLEVLLEGYGRETRKINIPTKGELIPFNITIPEASAPEKPQLTYPENNTRDIPLISLAITISLSPNITGVWLLLVAFLTSSFR
ncbi:PEGA domain-containing protein [Mesotoga sp. TolDC]|uniref:PEGA domain-containing protein n=1 Tax=Mesotoga sp. TolDC TaxID=1389250 RepID=UPI0035C7FAFE